MKGSSIMAAGALFGSASAGVHKMKLKKVPLSEQLVSGVMFITRPTID
jgi:saccharopepsin